MTRKKAIRYCILILVLFLLLTGGVFLHQKSRDEALRQEDLNLLSTGIYQGAFFSMYDIGNYPVEDFAYYFGISIVKTDRCLKNTKDLNDYLSAALSSCNELANLYIGLDPLALWKASGKDIGAIEAAFEETLFPAADRSPEISFEIFLSHPSLQYWLSLSEAERETAYVLYGQLAGLFDSRENISVFYAGGQPWLIANPKNYTDASTTTEEVSAFLFLSHYGDIFRIDGTNAASKLSQTASLVTAYLEAPPQYPDLSQWDIVFMGDSIIGNYTGSLSIPGVVNGLSGASVYNCAEGGVSAAEPKPGAMCFPKMAADFVNGSTDEPENNFGQGLQAYLSADHEGKQLLFVINFGLNDYFGGYPTENAADAYDTGTYAGALRTGIQKLQEAFPDALYLLIGPGKISYFNGGADIMDETGGQLTDYCRISMALAQEQNLPYLDLYNDFPQEDISLYDIWADGCHYNEYGRYLAGIKIIDSIAAAWGEK